MRTQTTPPKKKWKNAHKKAPGPLTGGWLESSGLATLRFATIPRDDPEVSVGVDAIVNAFDVGVSKDVIDHAARVIAAGTPCAKTVLNTRGHGRVPKHG